MHSSVRLLLALSASALSASSPVFAANASFPDAVRQGKPTLNARLRYEQAEQSGLRDSDALTLRTRLGFTTAPFHGFRVMLEGENVVAYDPDSYNQGGLNVPGPGAGRVVIADPEVTEVNQAWLAYQTGVTTATVGRQRLVLDNARFVGDVGWRQDQQTFDAVSLTSKTPQNLSLTYAYLWRINRIFADKLDWDSDSHIIHASLPIGTLGSLSGYGYLLDFDQAAVNSTQTFGLSLAGTQPLGEDWRVSYRGEYARQSEYGSSPLNYETDYRLLEVGLVRPAASAKLGYERLGSDNNVGFRTPLATLHAFNGWADLFLATPGGGLEDVYIALAGSPRKGLNLTAMYHWFDAVEGNARYGTELDLLASYAVTPRLTVLAKVADFDSEHSAFRDTRRYWLETTFTF